MFPNVLEVARNLIRERVSPGETVIDATMGNGNDTLFLATLVGQEGKVVAYDIQPQAIEKTRERLQRERVLERVEMKLASHEEMELLSDSAGAIMFNLGYLPGGNKEITTQASSTVRAISAGLSILKPGGIMTVMIYWGHAAGSTEKEAVLAYCSQLSQMEYLVLHYQYINQQNQAPFLIAIERRDT
ncbi:methyltransferase domain-containing protein [Brevibacillus ruminantium]|uniref:Methyltransferase domain-containing protein n=1 Tax=Brevibacillus ruminantium TaxID=2950604 RepID=A0ABY4WMN3_9BACL|nr:class I SAM-dependent methyltransferase [Brevibacillus ruminantium]USG68026.1 methyltransferase domain-containing protein [Brevibacillus ruminantium]